MAQVIKIKRSTGTSAPSTLAVGELAYSKGSDTFYVGDPATANTPIAIGGAIKNNAGTPVLATGVTADEIASLILPAISSNITLGDATDVTLTTAGGLTVTGDLTVNGTTTTVDTATLKIEDPLMILASNNGAADAVDIGFYGLYDTSGSQNLYSGLYRDANDSGKWKLFKDTQAEPTTTVDTSGTGYAVATLVANLEGNVTGGSLTLGGITINDIDTDAEFNDVDDHIMTSGAIKEKIEAYGYGTGDITQVTIANSADSSITGTGTGTTGAISFDLAVGTIDGGTY